MTIRAPTLQYTWYSLKNSSFLRVGCWLPVIVNFSLLGDYRTKLELSGIACALSQEHVNSQEGPER